MALTLPSQRELLLLKKLKFIISNSEDECDAANWGDEILLTFLRCRKLNVQSAFQRIENCAAAIKRSHKEVFENMYPERLNKTLDSRVMDVLKNRDARGSRIVIHRYCDWDAELHTADQVMQSIFLIAVEMLLTEKETQENGFVFVWDLIDFNFNQAKQLTPAFLRTYLGLFNNSIPVKIPSIHILNAPRVFNMTLNFIRFVLPKKLNKRIHVHGTSLESLQKEIPIDILPPYYGGLLSEEDAIENNIISRLKTPERNDYYQKVFLGGKSS